jgi:hypothetical protein
MGREYRIVERGAGWRDSYAAVLRDPERILARPETVLLKKGRSGRLVGIAHLEGAEMAIKVFDESALLNAIERLLLGSSARRVARNAERMRGHGLLAPEVIAVLECGSLLGSSCIVTRAISAGERSDVLWPRLGRRPRRALAEALGDFLRRTHARGLYPQDVSAANLLVLPRKAGWDVVLVDLDRVRQYRTLSWRRRLKNLVQLERTLGRCARAGERLAGLRAYLPSAGRAQRRSVAAQVLAASRAKDAEAERRARRRGLWGHP